MAEQLGSISDSEFSNYMRLQILLHKANEILRRLFIKKWNTISGTTEWEDDNINRGQFINGLGRLQYEKAIPVQKECLRSRSIIDWDLLILIQSVSSLGIKAPYDVLDELKSVRNKLAHLGEAKVSHEEYEKYWKQIASLLLKLGMAQEDIDEVKSAEIRHDDLLKFTPNSKATELKDSGNKAFKNKRYEEAVKFYTEAICIPDISNKELSMLYSNRSIAYFKLKDISAAKTDAKGSIHLSPFWWKGYARLGEAYKANQKYELAFKNFWLAKKFHPNPNGTEELADSILLCKRLLHQQSRNEHLDPANFCTTYEELVQKHPNTTAESLKERCDWGIKYNGATGMCTQGHNYYFGRGEQQNYEKAAEWYGKAAAEGNAEGLYNLGKMYLDGKGGKCSFREGIRLVEQAASQPGLIQIQKYNIDMINIGVGQAQHTLGLLYHEGTGVPKDYAKAKYWYTRAIKNWIGGAANNMALLHGTGAVLPQSNNLAAQYGKLGAVMGDVRSMENLVAHYFSITDFAQMQRWYLYAIEKGSIHLKLESTASIYRQFFQNSIEQNFKAEEFAASLWEEVKNGPLNHLIDLKVKAVHDRIYKCVDFIDSSIPELYKKSITLFHRKIFKEYQSKSLVHTGGKARLKPVPVVDLSNLKPICLQEMKKEHKDHIYEGFVLKLTIVEDPVDPNSETASIKTIAFDEQKSYERLFVYNYHPCKEELQENLGFGSKISIVNPYYRITKDGFPGIRVDNFDTVFIHSNSRNLKMCRYCGNEDDNKILCRTCKRCYYCSKKCLKLDESELNHNLVCKKNTSI